MRRIATHLRSLVAKVRVAAEPPASGGDRQVCAALWDTPMVQVNGDLTTCCLDEQLENRLGNVRETPLGALWNGPTMHGWRVAQAEGRFEASGPLCTRCNWQSAGALPSARVVDYLSLHGESTALLRYKRRRND